jgi:hypothetical protein
MEDAGKSRSNLNSGNARDRANKLEERMRKRLADLELELRIVARPPTVLGGALIVPIGWFDAMASKDLVFRETPPAYGSNPNTEILAMTKVLETERRLGFEPRDVSAENRGYDIESRDPKTGALRFIEVKGRIKGAATVTVTKNEILTGLNQPEAYILAIVNIEQNTAAAPHYIVNPFAQEPEFATASVNYKLSDLLTKGTQQME